MLKLAKHMALNRASQPRGAVHGERALFKLGWLQQVNSNAADQLLVLCLQTDDHKALRVYIGHC